MTDRFDCFISAEKSKKYEDLVDDPHSIFYKHTKSQVYIIAAAWGFYYNLRAPIEGKKQQLFVSTTFSSDNSRLLWILKSLGVYAKGIDSLRDSGSMATLCDEYANAGIDELHKIHKESDNEQRDYAITLIQILQNNPIKE